MSFMKRYGLLLLFWITLIVVGQQLRLSLPLGKQALMLSGLSVTLPLIGAFFSAKRAVGLGGGALAAIHLFKGIPLTLGIPSLFATLSWSASRKPASLLNWAMHLVLPLVAMVLFILTPAGQGAWSYTLYWWIPVLLCFISLPGRWSYAGRALQSTFVAHAVGSLFWVYLTPMSSQQWLQLIPVVAMERLVLAGLGAAFCLLLEQALLFSWQKGRSNSVPS